jgi:hypothetical protein
MCGTKISQGDYLLQRKIWRDKQNINKTMNGGQIRFYLRI